MATSKVTGLMSVKSGANASKTLVMAALELAIRQRAASHLDRLQEAASGPAKSLGPAINPGTGLDVPGGSLESNQIGEDTGRLRSRLGMAVNVSRNKVVGEIGFDKGIRGTSKAKSAAIKWPEKPAVVVVNPPGQDGARFQSTEPPEKYIPKVILGGEGQKGAPPHMGRNILRLSLYDDVMNERTLKEISKKVKEMLA